jgi:hypothetical protein
MRTTLNKIRAHSPCRDGWEDLLRGLGKTAADDEPLWIDQILNINGVDDALWCLRAVENCDREIRLYAVWCARRVQHLMTDPHSIAAFDVVERYARGEASDAELEAALGLAVVAAVAEAAASSAAWAAYTTAARSVDAAAAEAAVAMAAAWPARDTERAAQAEELRRVCREMRESGR